VALLLGPPGSGKTTLLQALAAKLDRDLRVGWPSSFSISSFLQAMQSYFHILLRFMDLNNA